MTSETTEHTNAADNPANAMAEMLRGDQRLRWLQGERFTIEAYFEHYPELRNDIPAQRALVAGEIALRREAGEILDPGEFRARFPHLAEWLADRFDSVRPQTSDDDSSNDDLADHPWPSIPGFEILAEIGRGGMGIVYKARQSKLNRVVALKMLLGGPAAGAKAVGRFRAEAEAVAQLQHPYIVQIFDIIEHDGQLYLALEYLSGGNLAKQIACVPQPPELAADYVRKLAQAMQFAHERGIIHRDLKPSNILLTADGIPKITDFGLAKRLDGGTSTTKTGAVLGTPDYMSPEQADGRSREVGPLADVYSLGAILYDLLTGQPPFHDEAMVKVLDAVRFKKPKPPRECNPQTPADLEAICLKCLEKDPARRYASAGELADDLTRFLNNEPVRATPQKIWKRIRSWWRQMNI
jgi:serine/threonine protein kinase